LRQPASAAPERPLPPIPSGDVSFNPARAASQSREPELTRES
jgi:hypothetical protein